MDFFKRVTRTSGHAMLAMSVKERVIKLRFENVNPDLPKEISVKLLKDWGRNAERVDKKARSRFAEGVPLTATVNGKPIALEADVLRQLFENSPNEVVIVIRVK